MLPASVGPKAIALAKARFGEGFAESQVDQCDFGGSQAREVHMDESQDIPAFGARKIRFVFRVDRDGRCAFFVSRKAFGFLVVGHHGVAYERELLERVLDLHDPLFALAFLRDDSRFEEPQWIARTCDILFQANRQAFGLSQRLEVSILGVRRDTHAVSDPFVIPQARTAEGQFELVELFGGKILAVEQILHPIRKEVGILDQQSQAHCKQCRAEDHRHTGLEIAANKQGSKRFKDLDEAFHTPVDL